jgi:predicted cobalt transporter CbtA
MRAVAKTLKGIGDEPPCGRQLYRWTLAGDVISNGLYYSLVGVGDPAGVWRRGAVLGLAGGIGAVVLPKLLGLGSSPSARTPATAAMTIAWYLAGGTRSRRGLPLAFRRFSSSLTTGGTRNDWGMP